MSSSSSTASGGGGSGLSASPPAVLALDAFRMAGGVAGARQLGGGKDARVTAMACMAGTLFVGNESGTIYVFAVAPHGTAGAGHAGEAAELVVKKKVGKKAVQQLDVMMYSGDAKSGGGGGAAGSKGAAPARALLLALIDSKLQLLDVHTLAPVLEIARDSSFERFCIVEPAPNASSSALSAQPRVCAQVKGKKKLMVYSCSVHTGRAEVIRELQVPDTVLVMAAQGDLLALGYKREYSLISMATDDVTDVPVPVEGITPLLCRVAPGELLLATTNSMGFFVSFEGEPMPRAPLLWQHTPTAVTSCGGYVLALLPEQSVAIASMMDQKQVQQVRLPGAPSAPTPPGAATLLLATYPNSDMVFVCVSTATTTDISAFYLTSLADQIEQYMELGLANEAAALLQRTNPTPQQLADFHVQAGFVLLRSLEWVQAFEHYFPQATLLDPRELLALFPDLTLSPMPYSGSWVAKLGTMASMVDAAKSKSNGARKGAAGGGAQAGKNKEVQNLSSVQLLKQARFYLAQFLWNWRVQRRKAAEEKAAAAAAAAAGKKGAAAAAASAPAVLDDVEVGVCVDTALLFLCIEFDGGDSGRGSSSAAGGSKLVRASSPELLSPSASPSTGEFVLPYSLRDLLFPSNACLLHESERHLFAKQQYNALALLFQSKGAVRKALEVWRSMGQGEFKQNSSATGAKDGKDGLELGEESSEARMRRRSSVSSGAPAPAGVAETVSLLSTLTDQPLLWEFAEWVIASWPGEGLKIFLSTSRPAGEQLHPEKVLTFLRRVQANLKAAAGVTSAFGGLDGDFAIVPTAANVGDRPTPSSGGGGGGGAPLDLVEAYLEYFVSHERTTDPKYHTQLALCYLKKVINLQLPASLATAEANAQANAANSAASRAAGGKQRSSSFTAGPSSVARFKPGHEPGMRGPPRLKLLKFLQRSQHYDPQAVLNSLLALQAPSGAARSRAGAVSGTDAASASARPSYSGLDLTQHASNLYEEVLLLCSRLGQHTRVLQIYVFDLRDEAGAAAYACYISQSARDQARKARDQQAKQASMHMAQMHSGEPNDALDDPPSAASSMPRRDNGGGGRADQSQGSQHIDESHAGDVFLNLLDIYFSPEYAQLWAERNPTAAAAAAAAASSSQSGVVEGPQSYDAALELLNKFYHLMDPVALLKLLPPTLPLHTLQHLFSKLLPATLHARRHNHVVSGLHKLVHLRVQSHCYSLRSLQLSLDAHVKCGWCYKSLNDAVFVAHPYHAVRDPLERAYIIDFENGGEPHAAIVDPVAAAAADNFDRKELLHEMPRYVLVHWTCSSQFVANGGVDALLLSDNAAARNRASSGSGLAATRDRAGVSASAAIGHASAPVAAPFTRQPSASVLSTSSTSSSNPFARRS